MALLSVIIISWDSLPMLRKCLGALHDALAQTRTDAEIVWTDNGSGDGAPLFMEKEYPEAKRILLPRNMGVAYARNRALEAASGQYLLLLDDDTEITPEALSAMLTHMENTPRCGICATALRDSEGRMQQNAKPFPGLMIKVRNVVASWSGSQRHDYIPPSDHVTHPDYVIGACQMIRRQTLDATGLLDENIFYGPEDADFCIRARKKGWTVDYLPTVSFLHHWRRATRRNIFSPLSRLHTKALLYFYLKHRRFL